MGDMRRSKKYKAVVHRQIVLQVVFASKTMKKSKYSHKFLLKFCSARLSQPARDILIFS
jgi:hypothetical protein